MSIQLEKENQQWVRQFIKKYKRKPRVLHISNIANNAYNNAKLLIQCGLENHVFAPNAFFAMGCPEWEDADFTHEITDMWNPDWSSLDLRDFCRPKWFASGDYPTCINYLIALCDGRKAEAHTLFMNLAQQNKSVYVEHAIRKRLKIFKKIFLALSSSLRAAVRDDDSISRDIGPWQVDYTLIQEFKKEFPQRQDQLSENDFLNYYCVRSGMRELIKRYDIVIGYAVEGIYPLMFGKPYFAFEHGTLRDIPYAQDTQGRLCALTYRKAAHVFVTNIDCIPSAHFLSPKKFSFMNHPYDEDQPLAIKGNWKQKRMDWLQELDADMILFHPTRHDWCKETGYADKANDVFLQAFVTLRKKGLRLGLICCEWGANVEQSKALLNHAGVALHVRWLKPLGVIAYTKMCLMADMVVDQFKLGSFGGVTFKALATGTPVMTYIDLKQVLLQFAEPPPVINCRSEIEIAQQLSYWYNNKNALKKIGESGRRWMKQFHNKSTTVNLQMAQFRLHFPVTKD